MTNGLRAFLLTGDVIESNTLHVIVLSYDSYCRMRALLKRLEGIEEEAMKTKVVKALGGFIVPSRRTRLLFCRDVFDYPELEGHDLLCNHLGNLSFRFFLFFLHFGSGAQNTNLNFRVLQLEDLLIFFFFAAPKLQGRPRKKRRRAESESESSETSEDQKPILKPKPTILSKMRGLTTKPNSLSTPKFNPTNCLPNQIKNEFSTPALDRLIEVDFMSKLYKFMKERNTAITRLPYIGYKQCKFSLFLFLVFF